MTLDAPKTPETIHKASFDDVAIGRAVDADQLREITSPFERVRGFEVRPNAGLIYATGHDVASELGYGWSKEGQMGTEAKVMLDGAVWQLQDEAVLDPTAWKPFCEDVFGLLIVKGLSTMAKLVLVARDVPNPHGSGFLQLEKGITSGTFRSDNPINQAKEVSKLRHEMVLGTAPVERLQILRHEAEATNRKRTSPEPLALNKIDTMNFADQQE